MVIVLIIIIIHSKDLNSQRDYPEPTLIVVI